MMNYLDLFSGIGGFALGAHRAGLVFDKHYFSEIDKYAKKIYQKHFPTAVDLGGVQNVAEGLGKIDLITFGFPCQDLSVAGKRAGLAGSRSGLFFEATRLIRFYKPSTFIFENVEGLLTSNDGKDFEIVLREIADIGLYECEWQLLNTSWFLPQNRKRVYFVGHFGKDSGRKIFPITQSNDRDPSSIRERVIIRGRNKNTSGCLDTRGVNAFDRSDLDKLIYCAPVLTPDRKNKRQNGRRMKEDGEPSFTLTGQDIHGVCVPEATAKGYAIAKEGDSKGMRVRRFTPTECCRLQGFPDDWVDGLSDSQKYRCLGNAVTVNVVEEIARRILQKVI